MVRLLFLEFNEINFESVAHYCSRGRLPHLGAVLASNGCSATLSEQRYEHLEPWIQWVTAHTGLSLAEHGVFRLGDIVSKDLPQIWEMLEDRGLKVGAISPMNAKHRLRQPAFFVPDPWTSTPISAPRTLERLYYAIAQAVNDNAQKRITIASAVALLRGLLRYARPGNYARYGSYIARVGVRPWYKALVLDLLLADIFIGQVRGTQPNFATLFLNAGAHIQHHYMFCSGAYRGPHRNPAWYVTSGVDPVLEVYELYDQILADVRRTFPDTRIMIATGLHQDPHEELTYYWRLKDHVDFLRGIGVSFERVEPRMSRDFLVVCATADAAAQAAEVLRCAVADDGLPLFEVDNRGGDLFVMFTYPRDITKQMGYRVGTQSYKDLHRHVAFVALKNGEHNGRGYFLDTGLRKGEAPAEFPLKEIPERILSALGLAPSATALAT